MYDIISELIFHVKRMGTGKKYAHFQRIELPSNVYFIYESIIISMPRWACKMLNHTQKVLEYNASLRDYTISLLIVHEKHNSTEFLKPYRIVPEWAHDLRSMNSCESLMLHCSFCSWRANLYIICAVQGCCIRW